MTIKRMIRRRQNYMKKSRALLMTFIAVMIMGIFSLANVNEVKAASTSITVKKKTVTFNDTTKTLNKKLGKYKASYTEPTGIRGYVYNSTKGRFIIAYTKGNKVIGYFVLSKVYRTPNAKSGYSYKQLKKKKFTDNAWYNVKSESGYINNGYFAVEKNGSKISETEYLDYWGNKKTFAAKVYLSKYSIYFSDYGVKKYSSSAISKGIEKETLYVTNAFREYIGTSSLASSGKVAKVARAHSKDMATNGYFSHYSLDGRSPFDRMLNAGINYSWAGENIAAGQNCGVNFVLAWISSQGHRDNITNSYFKYLGVGYAYNASSTYGTYLTQNFCSFR